MDKILKLERLDILPNTASTSKIFNHWLHTFSALIRRTEIREDLDKLDLLVTYISPDIYEYIAEQTIYYSAINRPRELYIKSANEIFARHSSFGCVPPLDTSPLASGGRPLFGGVGFIARRLGRPEKGNADGVRGIFGTACRVGLRPCDRTHLKNGLVQHSYAGGA